MGIIIIIVSVIIISFLYIDRYLYKGPIDKAKYVSLFKDSLQNKIQPVSASANREEAFYLYRLSDSLRIIIWKINGLSEVSPQNILIYNRDEIKNPVFSNYFQKEIINPDIYFLWRGEFIRASNIIIEMLNKDDQYNLQRGKNFLFIKLRLQKLMFSDENSENMIFLQAKKWGLETELFLYKTNDSFFIFILNKDKGKLNDVSLFDLLDLDIKYLDAQKK
mgnify:CR=1 FL=1